MNRIKEERRFRIMGVVVLFFGLLMSYKAVARFKVKPAISEPAGITKLKKEILSAEGLYVAVVGSPYPDPKLQKKLKDEANKELRKNRSPFLNVFGDFHPTKIIETLKGVEQKGKTFSCPYFDPLSGKDIFTNTHVLIVWSKGEPMRKAACLRGAFGKKDRKALEEAISEGLKLRHQITAEDFKRWESLSKAE